MDNMWGDDWVEVRAQWPLTKGVAHLNHGSFGTPPVPVLKRQSWLRSELVGNPDRFFRRRMRPLLEEARLRAAAYCNAAPDSFALITNTSTGINTVLGELDFSPGDELVMTDHAYGAVRAAVERACRRTGAVQRVVPISLFARDEVVESSILASVNDRTRLVIIDHVTCCTARLLPIESLVVELHERDVPVLVDGAHAPGMVHVDLDRMKPDFWVGSFHKWAGAPHGTGGLYVAPGWHHLVEPLVAPLTLGEVQETFPQSFVWSGTLDPTALLVIPTAIEFMSQLGWHRLQSHNYRLAEYGRQVLAKSLDTLTDSPTEPQTAMSLVALPQNLVRNAVQAYQLQELIAEELLTEVSVMAWQGRGWIRLSAQVYNAPEEYDRLAEQLPARLNEFVQRSTGEAKIDP
jgi:isopenicillin-N epimerase